MSKSKKAKSRKRVKPQRVRVSIRKWNDEQAKLLAESVFQYHENRGLDVEATMKKISDVLLPENAP